MAPLGITVLKHNVPWGPFSHAQVDEALSRGDFTVKYLAHAPGLKEWLPLGEVLDYVERSESSPRPLLPPVPGPRDVPSVRELVPPPIPTTTTTTVRPPILPPNLSTSSASTAPVPPVFVPAPVKPVAPPEPILEPASFFLRTFAFVIDFAILFAPVALVFALCALTIIVPSWWNHPSKQAYAEEWEWLRQNIWRLLLIVAVGISWLYAAGLESSGRQATIGKRWMGMKVTDAHGERISFLHATGRYAAKYLSALPCFLGFIAALASSRRLALHDRLAGTRVVRS